MQNTDINWSSFYTENELALTDAGLQWALDLDASIPPDVDAGKFREQATEGAPEGFKAVYKEYLADFAYLESQAI